MEVANSVLDTHNVRVLGSGDYTVVLSHGYGGDQSIWKYVVPSLLSHGNLRVVLYDMMGAGTTDTADFSFSRYSSLHAYADDLLSVLDELDVESCVFVGHSMSGMVGCLASIQRPQIFQTLILLAASPRYLNDTDYYGGFEQSDLDQLFTSIKSNFSGWVSGFAPVVAGGDSNPSAVQEFSRSLLAVRPDVALSVAQTIFQSDLRSILPQALIVSTIILSREFIVHNRGRLAHYQTLDLGDLHSIIPQVTVPCHILQTQKDMAVPGDVADYMNRNLGGWSSVELLETEGHLPQLTAPEVVVPVLLRCIDE